tara:strand:+ start:807 stop:1268 length:462 start_codon:yes stop_codon:yes gene_type:complete
MYIYQCEKEKIKKIYIELRNDFIKNKNLNKGQSKDLYKMIIDKMKISKIIQKKIIDIINKKNIFKLHDLKYVTDINKELSKNEDKNYIFITYLSTPDIGYFLIEKQKYVKIQDEINIFNLKKNKLISFGIDIIDLVNYEIYLKELIIKNLYLI